MSWRIIGTLVSKDLSLFFRKKLILALTALGLVFYLVIYFVMPSSVNENLEIGLYAPVIPPVFELVEEEGLEIEMTESEEALKELRVEGAASSGWVLMDYGSVIVHVFSPAVRDYYRLESLWSDAPVKVKMQ